MFREDVSPRPRTETLYLTGAGWKGGDWRDVQNLQLVHDPVENDGGSVHISAPSRRVDLREVVIDELADDRSFPHSGSADDCDTQRLHHSWSASSAPWTATTTSTDVAVQRHSWPPLLLRWHPVRLSLSITPTARDETNQWANKSSRRRSERGNFTPRAELRGWRGSKQPRSSEGCQKAQPRSGRWRDFLRLCNPAQRGRVYQGHRRATSSPQRWRKSASLQSPHGHNLPQFRL